MTTVQEKLIRDEIDKFISSIFADARYLTHEGVTKKYTQGFCFELAKELYKRYKEHGAVIIGYGHLDVSDGQIVRGYFYEAMRVIEDHGGFNHFVCRVAGKDYDIWQDYEPMDLTELIEYRKDLTEEEYINSKAEGVYRIYSDADEIERVHTARKNCLSLLQHQAACLADM